MSNILAIAAAGLIFWVVMSAYKLDREECWHGYSVPSHASCHGIQNRNGQVLQ